MIHRSKKVFDGPLSEVRKSDGEGIHLSYDGDGRVFEELRRDGLLTRVNDGGKEAELYASPGVDPQAVLARLVGRIKVRKFDLREPSLHEIFVRRATESELEYQSHRTPGVT